MNGYLSNRWRIFVESNGGNANYIGIHQCRMFDSNGDNAATGGTASASSNYSSWVPANAFDGDDDTDAYGGWLSGQGLTANEWLEYEFPTPVNIREVEIKSMSTGTASGNDEPNDFRIEVYVGGEWVVVQRYTNQAATWAPSTWKMFDASEVYTELVNVFTLSGYTLTPAGRPVSRIVNMYDHSGESSYSVVSDPVTGYWEQVVDTGNPHTIIVEDSTGLYKKEIREFYPMKTQELASPV